MNVVVSMLKACQGKLLKSVREDVKTGVTTLEFEDNALVTKVTVQMKGSIFISSTIAAVKKTKPSLKAKEQALEPVVSKKSKKKKPSADKAGGLTM